jgi:hypothetical protein
MVFYQKNDMPLLLFGRKPIVAGDPKKIEMGLKAKGHTFRGLPSRLLIDHTKATVESKKFKY